MYCPFCDYTLQISDSCKPFTSFFLFTLKYVHPPTHTENINMIKPQIIHIPQKIAIIINAFDILFEYNSLLRERMLCPSSISLACNPFK